MKMHFPVAPFTQLRSENKELLPSPECSDWVQPQPKGSAERRAVTPRQLCRAALLVELVAMAFHLQRWNLLKAHVRLISLFNQQKFRIPSLKVFFFFRHPKMKFLNHTNTRNPQKNPAVLYKELQQQANCDTWWEFPWATPLTECQLCVCCQPCPRAAHSRTQPAAAASSPAVCRQCPAHLPSPVSVHSCQLCPVPMCTCIALLQSFWAT